MKQTVGMSLSHMSLLMHSNWLQKARESSCSKSHVQHVWCISFCCDFLPESLFQKKKQHVFSEKDLEIRSCLFGTKMHWLLCRQLNVLNKGR